MVKLYYTENATTHINDFNLLKICEYIVIIANSNADMELYIDREDVFHIISRKIENKKLSKDNIQFFGDCDGVWLEIRLADDGTQLDSIPNSLSQMIFEAQMGIEKQENTTV